MIAGARVTFQENPYPVLCESLFAIEVPVTGSPQETAKRLLAAAYSLMLTLGGPGPCDLWCSEMPYREFVVVLPCPRQLEHPEFLMREMAEVSERDLGELERVTNLVLGLREEDFHAFATAMKHYWQATFEVNGANRVTHLVAALDKILRKPGAERALAVLPCRIGYLISEQAAETVKRAVDVRNRVQHGVPPPESEANRVGDETEPVVRRTLERVLEKIEEGRYRDLIEQLNTLCAPRAGRAEQPGASYAGNGVPRKVYPITACRAPSTGGRQPLVPKGAGSTLKRLKAYSVAEGRIGLSAF